MEIAQTSSDLPLVSVIIPAYNGEKFIRQTLESILSQTYQNFEVTVVDDGSQDSTAEIVKAYCQKDSRITILQQENSGVAAARNLAIRHSRGEYIAPIDADDIWYPENLEQQVQCLLNSDSGVGVVYSWSVDINEAGYLMGGFYNSTFEGDVYKALVYKYFIGNASASLIRRACFEQVGSYNCQMRAENAQGCEDWELHLRIAEQYQFKVVPAFLVGYRQIMTSMSTNYTAMAKAHALIIQEVGRRHPEIPIQIYHWSSSNFYVYLAVKSSRNQNPQSTLFWLSQAFKEDWLMMLLRHNLYQLTLENIVKCSLQSISPQLLSESPKKEEEQMLTQPPNQPNFDRIVQRMTIHKFLPSQIYERMRFQRWCQVASRTQ